MKFRRTTASLVLAALVSVAGASEPTVDFNRDVRPILSNHCFTCHGPDEAQRQTELRFDQEASAKSELDSGVVAIVAGDPKKSELIHRITTDDADMRMPPVDSQKQLSEKEIAILQTWVKEGAKWQGHWSFQAPSVVEIPEAKDQSWPENPIDHFILARLTDEGLTPSSEADKRTLIRRVTLDLTGLPPTVQEVQDFLADTDDGAYERLVDRLLLSPRYGEQRARYWLDAARYGDTHGLHLDNIRSLWPYRDWVIKAFNSNMPFDQFTIEQLAGDLLPNPTRDQLIATGFNRCNVTTSEGGSIAEEYRVRYAVDRVDTTSTVWMGLTAGCAVCHDHKYDPLSQREFFQLFAYFGNLDENPMDGNALLPPPVIKVPSKEQESKQKKLNTRLAALREDIRQALAKVDYKEPKDETETVSFEKQEYVWIDDAIPDGATPQSSGQGTSGWQFVGKPDHPVFCGEKAMLRTSTGLGQHFFTGATKKLQLGQGDVFFCYVYLDPENPPKEIMLQFNDGSWDHRAIWGEDRIDWGKANTPSRFRMGDLPKAGEWVRLEVPAEKVGFKAGSVVNGWAFTQFDGTVFWDRAGIVTSTPQVDSSFDSLLVWEQFYKTTGTDALPKSIQKILKKDRAERNEKQSKDLLNYFIEHAYAPARDLFEPLHKELKSVEGELVALDKQIPGTMVMKDRDKPRDTFVLIRGEYDKPDKDQKVEAGVPGALPPLPDNAPKNRLALAKWLMSPEHPLTARVTVNRYWQQYFGTGLVKTSEDFGAQGEWPSHPKLLDWLALEFINSGWDVKHIHRLIVTSATYKQSSKVTPELYKKDRANRLLARGPRFRLDAEMIRDQALFISGLMQREIGGPSVKPYQPEGLWEAVGYTDSNTAKFKQDEGEKLFRRSMYTFWKRTSPPPTMAIFDAPSREACTVRRARTNTPLQALALLNDVQFVEAARHFASRILQRPGDDDQKLSFAFEAVTARPPTESEREVVLQLLKEYREEFGNDIPAAEKLLSVGDTSRDESLKAEEWAAWTMIANLLLNLDEAISKG